MSESEGSADEEVIEMMIALALALAHRRLADEEAGTSQSPEEVNW